MEKFYTIQEAIDIGIIPQDYANMFSTLQTCKCGHPYVMNKNATVMKCSNINCINSLAGRAEEIYKKFGLVGWGQIEIEKYIYLNGIGDMYTALINPPQPIASAVENWLNTKHTSTEILQILNLPGLGINCQKVFDKIQTYEHFKECIKNFSWLGYFKEYDRNFAEVDLKFKDLTEALYKKNGDFNAIRAVFIKKYKMDIPQTTWQSFNEALFRAGLKELMVFQFNYYGTNSGIMADKVYNILLSYWSDIDRIFNRVECLVDNREEVPIVITGDIVLTADENNESFVEKEDFVRFLNNESMGLNIRFNLCQRLKTAPFIIADYESTTRKYREGASTGRLYNSYELVSAVRTLTNSGILDNETVDKKIEGLKILIDKSRNK